jgi:alpha-tubulin suppressor-like RCC1 family protein
MAEVVYVSLPPDSVPGGEGVRITNLATEAAVAAPVMDGGFDPIPIAASVGDSLMIEISANDTLAARIYRVVPDRRPPVVVRTRPPNKKKDVPLNTSFHVVFSEPVNPSTITTATIQLFDGITPVDGSVSMLPGSELEAVFQPSAALLPGTDYTLSIGEGVTDLNDEQLERPVDVTVTTTPVGLMSLSAGVSHTCALTGEGRAFCWGKNWNGQLGVGTVDSSDHLVLEPVQHEGSFVSISAGEEYTCGIDPAGTGWCWGLNDWSQLGVTERFWQNPHFPNPTETVGGITFRTLQAGMVTFPGTIQILTCGSDVAGITYCWATVVGALTDEGRGAILFWTTHETPTAVPAGGFTQVGVGERHACGLRGSGVFCWGGNWNGQLGIPSLPTGQGPEYGAIEPLRVLSGQYLQLTVGGAQSCALAADGTAYCWGFNGSGQVGSGSTDESVTAPVQVQGGIRFASISAGCRHTCALTAEGVAYCWGRNSDGQLGNGETVNRHTPVAVAGGVVFRAITAGYDHTCGIATDGSAYCWGKNEFGQLGDGTTQGSTTPVRVQYEP